MAPVPSPDSMFITKVSENDILHHSRSQNKLHPINAKWSVPNRAIKKINEEIRTRQEQANKFTTG